ncbi:MAG: aldehyde dehydrogenase (NADP(+)) [Flavobacteriia bacterium]|nr:aldehyde dehydrogenase (NADP(+)) [Flavobacteriia bacterium]
MNIGHRIGYQVSDVSHTYFQSFNPQLNEKLPELICEITAQEIEEAVNKAANAFCLYQKISGAKKAQFLKDIVEEINLKEQQLIHLYCLESGLSIERAKIELTRTLLQIENFSNLIQSDTWRNAVKEKADMGRIPIKPDLRKGLFPLGPVVVFGASNFPFAYSTIGGDAVAALASGCTVIVKSHAMHVQTSDLMADLVLKAARKNELPDGVFSHLNSQEIELGKRLVQHPKVKAVGFTGSINGGKAVMKLAQERDIPIPVFAEMGSSNPVVILASALEHDSDKWSTLLCDSIVNGAGQFCTKPGLIFVLDNEKSNEFIKQLREKLFYKDFHCMLHPQIYLNYKKIVQERALKVEIYSKSGDSKPNFGIQAIGVCSDAEFCHHPELQEEVFGPFTLVIKCRDIEKLQKCIAKLNGQLTGTLVYKDEIVSEELIDLIHEKVGRFIFNGVPTGVEVVKAMQHGGPFPSSSDSQYTAVGIDSIYRFTRSVSYQNCPENLLPEFLK